jgi:hypothetical protein
MTVSDPAELAALLLKGAHDGHDPEVVRRCAEIAYRVDSGVDAPPPALLIQVLVTELARSVSLEAGAPSAILDAFRGAMRSHDKVAGSRGDATWQEGAPAAWSLVAPACADRARERLLAAAQGQDVPMFDRALAAMESDPASQGPTQAQLQWIMAGKRTFACLPVAARVAAMPRFARPDEEGCKALERCIAYETSLSGSTAAGARAWRSIARRNPQEQAS